MIVKCTEESVGKVISYCEKGERCFVNIEKDGDEFAMQYDLISEIAKKEAKPEEFVSKCNSTIKRSLIVTRDLIKQLTQFKKALGLDKDMTKVAFRLKYDCSLVGKNNLPTLSYGSSYPTNFFNSKSDVKQIVVNWEQVFSDRLNDYIPDLFVKKSSKKYAPATFKELVDILSKI
jgi:hypothetical protein